MPLFKPSQGSMFHLGRSPNRDASNGDLALDIVFLFFPVQEGAIRRRNFPSDCWNAKNQPCFFTLLVDLLTLFVFGAKISLNFLARWVETHYVFINPRCALDSFLANSFAILLFFVKNKTRQGGSIEEFAKKTHFNFEALFQCWAVLTHRLKIDTDFQSGSQ